MIKGWSPNNDPTTTTLLEDSDDEEMQDIIHVSDSDS